MIAQAHFTIADLSDATAEVIVGTQNQTITLKHEAHSRALFAEGALAAADFLIGKPAGMYDMTSIVG